MKKFLSSGRRAIKGLTNMVPIVVGVVLLVGLVKTAVPEGFYTGLFQENIFLDSLIGATVGSFLTGNAATSYIIGGELMEKGIKLLPVTGFLVSWVTVGIVQMPAESVLGKKFAIIRNVTSFVLAVVVAGVTVFLLGLL